MSENKQSSYQEFRDQYEQHHPASLPQAEIFISEYPRWVIWVVGGMFVTAAFFSGLHTVPIAYDAIDKTRVIEWLRQVGGMSVFVFIEAGILLSAYLLVKRFTIVMLAILLITITVAMGANLYSVSKAFQSDMTDTFTRAITVLFGLVAPLMAALSGGVFVGLHQSERSADARMQSRLKERQIEWDKEIEREWKKFQKGTSRGDFMKTREIGEVHEPVAKPAEKSKPRVKLHEVAKEIREKGDHKLSAAEMMEKYDISLGSTTKIREILASSNGHSNGEGKH